MNEFKQSYPATTEGAERALQDMLRAGGKLGARALGAEAAIGFTAAFSEGWDIVKA